MRIYIKKKHMKYALILLGAVLVLLALLKLVSWWDSKQGLVDPGSIVTTVPPTETPEPGPDISVREPSEEEKEALSDGNLTKDQLVQDLVEDAVVQPPATEGSSDSRPVQTEYERQMAEIIAKVYVLRDEYVMTLDSMYAEAEPALADLVNKEGSEEEIASLISSYLTKASELEAQCDGQIDVIVTQMEQLIQANDGDMSPVDTLIETYATEKATKKAWYISRLEEKGLIS